MINLLPTTTKHQIRAARVNVILINYLFLSTIAAIFLAGSCFVAFLILNDSKTTAETIIKNKQTVAITAPNSTTSVASMNTEFSTARAILNQQVNYSDIIINLGGLLPSGVIIDSLSVNSNIIGTPLSIKARAKSSDKIDLLKTNLQSSTQFTNYKVGEQTRTQSEPSDYPIEFKLDITINKVSK